MKLKKADISMNTIVYAVIAVLVLLVMVLIFSKGVGKPSGEINKITGESDITGCNNFLLGRKCLENCDASPYTTEVTSLDPACKTAPNLKCCQTETGK